MNVYKAASRIRLHRSNSCSDAPLLSTYRIVNRIVDN